MQVGMYVATNVDYGDSQDDFFKKLEGSGADSTVPNVVKVDDLRDSGDINILFGEKPDDSEFNYEGRLADRVTEAEYTTENLMAVSRLTMQTISDISPFMLCTFQHLVRSKVCRQGACLVLRRQRWKWLCVSLPGKLWIQTTRWGLWGRRWRRLFQGNLSPQQSI